MNFFHAKQFSYLVVDANDPPPIEFTEQAAREDAFNEAYLNKTGKR
jgi:hypothetical protein